ncbi:MAG: TRAP transporter large permease [Peptococcaceae bacterium]|nr:TRAP transporter large permease [Peptococcaceae bacterium]
MGAVLMTCFAVLAIWGLPIAIVLGLSAFIALWFCSLMPITLVPQQMFTAVDSFPLLAIPLFMIAGALMEFGGISRRLIRLANSMVGHLTGGLALVAIITCMFFAAISGSGPATVAAIGGIMIPAMQEAGYDKGYAAAVMALAGAIGIIIPPSIPMVTFAVMSNVSISGLFTAGFFPGIVVGLSLMICAWWIAKKKGYGKQEQTVKASAKERIEAFKEAFWAILMPVIILGGIYGGIFTPTEAAAVGCFYGLLVGTVIYRELKLKDIPKVLTNAAVTTAMIMLIIATAKVFGWIMTSERIPDAVARTMMSWSENKYVILLIINLMLLVVGCFMETNAALIILTPIFLPIVVALGVNPIHFGIIMIVNLAIGMSTPPLGVNLFVACGINKISIERISKAAVPFLIFNILALLLITYIEPISMILPKLFGIGA